MVNPALEKLFFNQILKNTEYIHTTNPRFFQVEPIRIAFEICKEFYTKYNKAPTENQLVELSKVKNTEEQLPAEKIRMIFNVDLNTYDDQWLKENLEAWIEYKNLDTSIFDLIQYMKTTQITPENIKDVVQTAKSLISERNNLDFTFDEGLDFYKPESHEQKISDTFPTGYPYIDLVTGGFSLKTLWVLLGAAKVGKCFFGSSKVNIRSKKTGEILEIPVEMLFEKIIPLRKFF